MSLLELKNVNKTYENGTEPLHVLKDVSFSVEEGEFVAIVGPSGSGKSTILNIIGGLDHYDSGEVSINGKKYNHPKIILADEPTGNLDSETGEKVLELMLNGIQKYGQTLIMITHNKDIAKKAHRIISIRDGVVSEGPENQHQQTPFAKAKHGHIHPLGRCPAFSQQIKKAGICPPNRSNRI